MTVRSLIFMICVTAGLQIVIFSKMAEGFKIGAFNIQVFGRKKAGDPKLMSTIAKILRRYDIVLVQEIRDASGQAVEKLLQEVNKYSGKRHKYEMLISDRLGRTRSKEQYAFLYRTAHGIEVRDSYHYDDGDEAANEDSFQREPFIVRFTIPQLAVKDIAMVAIHTDPDEAVAETKELSRVIRDAVNRWNIDNVIVMGDLNADCNYFPKKAWKKLSLRTNPKYFWPIGDSIDTTTTNTDCAYDRFVLTGSDLISSYIDNSAGVFDFGKEYGLTKEQTLAVSDHYPIEMELALETLVNTERYVEDDTSTNGCSDRIGGFCSSVVVAFASCFGRLLNVRNDG